jgi:hypothetical protein
MAIKPGLMWTTRSHLESAEPLHGRNYNGSRDGSYTDRDRGDFDQLHMASKGVQL